MTAPIEAPENTAGVGTRSPATDHGPRTTDSARAAANRLNALKSTGPRTPEGKAKAALNALKHGLTAQAPLLPTEDPAEYELFAEGYLEELDPQSVEQFNLAQQLILTSWKLNRIPQIEAKVLAEHENRHPLMLKWRQDCANVEYQNATRRHPLPLPEKPVIPSTTTDDLIALSFYPKPPTPGTATTGEPLGAALHRLRQYHTTLLNTYLKLLKKFETLQNEPNPETQDSAPDTHDSACVGSASADATPDTPVRNEPNSPDLSNLKSQMSNSPAAPLSARNYQPSTTSRNEPNSAPPGTPDSALSTSTDY